MYELCLEYGYFPVKEVGQVIPDPTIIPDFLKEDNDMVTRLTAINELFHQLFSTIECKFDYIGGQFPEILDQIRPLYAQLAKDLQSKYGEHIDLRIEALYI